MKRILSILAVMALAGVGWALLSQIGPNDNAAAIAQAEAVGQLAGALQVQALVNFAGQCLAGALLVFFFLAGAGVGLAGMALWAMKSRGNETQPDYGYMALPAPQVSRRALPERASPEAEVITSDELFEQMIIKNWR